MNNVHGLYLVTPDWDDTDKLLDTTERALQGGASLVQYRHKTAQADQRQEQGAALLRLCRRYQRPFIINDHIDLMIAIDADGVHVGTSDMAVATVRDQIGPEKILGASCYGDMALAQAAYVAGASYLAFGGFYPSTVKLYDVTTHIEIIQQAKQSLPLPVVVIGGMTPRNAAPLIRAGADSVAAISAVYQAKDPQDAARAFVALFS